jgi:hypothetical protein
MSQTSQPYAGCLSTFEMRQGTLGTSAAASKAGRALARYRRCGARAAFSNPETRFVFPSKQKKRWLRSRQAAKHFLPVNGNGYMVLDILFSVNYSHVAPLKSWCSQAIRGTDSLLPPITEPNSLRMADRNGRSTRKFFVVGANNIVRPSGIEGKNPPAKAALSSWLVVRGGV